MNDLQIFKNNQFGEIRTLEENGKILFCGSDVAKALGYSNTRDALSRHCKGVAKHDTLTNGGNQALSFIPEGDLYRLITNSKLPSAEKFESWVFDDVLPSIRKTGTYVVQNRDKSKTLEIKEMNAKVRMSNQFLKLSKVDTLSKEYKNILVSKATEVLTGEILVSIPKSVQKTYTATELGELFGVTAQRIGITTNKYNLKTEQYGEWYRDKSRHSVKEVDTFVYYDSVIPVLEDILGVSIAV